MSIAKARVGVLAGCLTVIVAVQVRAEDWPQWLGPHRDGKIEGFTPPETWPKELAQKWKVSVGTGDSSPALVGDKLYVFSRQDGNEVISCLEADTGTKVWEDKYPTPDAGGAASRHGSGPRSSPVVSDGKVVTLGVNGVVSCLNAADGKLLWRNKDYTGRGKVPRFFTSMSPLVVDGMAILQLGGDMNGAFIAFDLATGKPKWTWAGDGAAYASPVLMTVDGEKVIISQTNRRVVALSAAEGKLLWSVPFAPMGMGYNAVTPLVDGQTLIYSGQGRGITAVKFAKKGDKLEATQLWNNPDLGSQFSTPVLKDGLIFGLSDKGKFFCIEAKTGKTAWTDSVARQNYGTILDAGSIILALTSKSQLSVIKATDKAFTELAQIKVASSPTYASPVIAGKRLFVKDQDSLALLTLP
jgi:outer membrane protein assembly factor BamB